MHTYNHSRSGKKHRLEEASLHMVEVKAHSLSKDEWWQEYVKEQVGIDVGPDGDRGADDTCRYKD